MTPGAWVLPNPKQVEQNIDLLRHLHGADLVDPLVEISLSPEQLAFLARLGLLGHPAAHIRMSTIRLRHPASDVEVALLTSTVPGGPLDPAHLGGDVVWVAVIKTVLEVDVASASRFARKLYAHLTRIAWDNTPGAVHPVTFSVSAYVIAFVEHTRGRGYQARRWAYEAHAHVEHEASAELAIWAYLRFCRIWVGVDGKV